MTDTMQQRKDGRWEPAKPLPFYGRWYLFRLLVTLRWRRLWRELTAELGDD